MAIDADFTPPLSPVFSDSTSQWGDASIDTLRGYRGQLAAWCADHAVDARTATVDHVKRYREDLVAIGRQPTTIAHKLNVLRRVYTAAVAPDCAPTTRSRLCAPRATGERPRISVSCPRSS